MRRFYMLGKGMSMFIKCYHAWEGAVVLVDIFSIYVVNRRKLDFDNNKIVFVWYSLLQLN